MNPVKLANTGHTTAIGFTETIECLQLLARGHCIGAVKNGDYNASPPMFPPLLSCCRPVRKSQRDRTNAATMTTNWPTKVLATEMESGRMNIKPRLITVASAASRQHRLPSKQSPPSNFRRHRLMFLHAPAPL